MANGYDPSAFPVSYKDPAYDQADQAAANAVGIPAQLLTNIRTKGEKSNADQISSAGAATPYQIIPSTRAMILKQTGVDPWLNPQAAAYGAAYLLKQSMDRNGGNPVMATAEYIGGTNRDAWGPQTMAYVKRVAGMSPNHPDANNPYAVQALPGIGSAPGALQGMPQGFQPSSSNPYAVAPLPNIGAAPGALESGPSALQMAYDAYQGGRMSPEDASQFEQDVQGGRIILPQGSTVGAPKQPAQQAQTPQAQPVPQQVVDAYNAGKMSPQDAQQFAADVKSGSLMLPQGAALDPVPQSQGIPADVGRQLGLTARDTIQGVGNTAGLLYDPIAAVLNKTGALIGHDPQIAPLGARAAGLANRLGLPQPQGSLERGVNAATQGAVEAASSIAPANAVAKLPGLMGQIGGVFGADAGKQVAAMAAGQAASQHASDAGYSPAVQAAIGMGTTMLTLGGAQALEGMAGKAQPAVNDLAQRLYASSRAEGGQAAVGTQTAEGRATAMPESTTAAPAALPEASSEQAQMATQMVRMQQGQAREAAAGVGTSPEGGMVGAQEAAGGASAAPSEGVAPAAAAAQSEASINPAASPLASAAQDFMPSDELAAQMRKATGSAPFGIGKSSAREILASQAAPDPETLAAAKSLGIEDNLQPDHLTSNQAYRELAQAVKSTPGSLARAQEMEGLQSVGQRATQLIEDLGGTRDLSGLSGQVKNELMSTQQQLDQKAEGLYQSLRDTVPAKMGVDASNVLGFIKQRADDLGGAKNLSPIERMIQSKLVSRELPVSIGGQEVSPSALGLAPQMQQPTYALLDDIRKSIGSGLRNQGPFKDADQGLLKALYGRISEDQRGALSTIPGALEQFDTARATVQMRKSVEDDMTSLFGKQLGDSLVGKLGTAMAVLPKGDEAKLVGLLKSVPPSMRQQVTASGLAYAFGKATKNGELNFKTFADWMDGLKKNPAAFNAVMGNLPDEGRQQLLALAKVSRGISNATREAITTGRIMAAREELAAPTNGLMDKVMNAARRAAVGMFGSAASAAAAHVGGPVGAGLGHMLMSILARGKPDVMKASDELIVIPEFQRAAKEGAAASQQTISTLANSPKFRRFYDLARDASAANDPASRARWLMGALSASQSLSNSNNRNR
ncbi:hypothetical protein [Burkholderia thailandensis]|uniref:hypothetical protein n=1 Tax=Burkholderia thailandensis TaxID=57975 RepID=UPI00107EC38D|nr:hypothetical protein [Burkholderia thailandensis]TGB34406.1 hypothetical protein C6946_07195 [Burkholderia thailandensis]